MPRPSRLPLVACLGLILCASLDAQPLPADHATWRLCGGNPAFAWQVPLRPMDDPDQASLLHAGQLDVSGQDTYRFERGATISQPGRHIAAEQIDYIHSSGAYQATGGVRYQDRHLALQAARAEGNLPRRQSRLESVDYRLVAARGNGSAQSVSLDGNLATLLGLDYSTCDPAARGWALRARQLELDQAEGFGVARDATLRVGSVPVLWLPYLSFPTDDRRRSGLLFPSIGYADETGIDLRLPWYLNLAPNVDATLTPRILGRRGVMLGGELRYLTAQHSGILEGSWLPDDDLNGRDRGSVRFRHSGALSPFWRVDADFNQVSDDRYFEDFGDSLTARATSLLESRGGLYGRGPGWTASLLARDFQITDPLVPGSAEPYRQLPRARFALDRSAGPALRYGLDTEAVHFDHDDAGRVGGYQRGAADRYDIAPWVELNLERAAGYLRPRFSYRHTAYQLSQDWLRSLEDCNPVDCASGAPQLWPDRSPTRSLPVSSLDAALNFERQSTLFGQSMLQTLQPRLYYLNVPFEAQDDLPLFDTQELTFGYDQLFRSNRFSGADRQSDANQLTLALSSRWFENASGRERLALALGQIRYFDSPRVGLDGTRPARRDASAWVAAVDLALSRSLSAGLSQQWDPEIDHTTVSGARLQWRGEGGALGNLGYRYRRAELEQVDASFALPLGEGWRWIGRWNYSLRDEGTLEAFAGFEWQSCCVAVRVLGRHYVRNRESEKNNALFVELELKGLARFGRDTEEFLERAILGYSR